MRSMGIQRASTNAILGLTLGLAPVLAAAAQAWQPPQTTDAALQAMTDAAGVIFTGTVTGVHRAAQTESSAGIVEIDFAVTDAIRGVTGSTYSVREWAGLWQANDEPFRPGQRYLMLLHAPNSAGLSSPVGGTDGAIPIHGSGNPAAGTTGAVPRVRGTAQTSTQPAAETTGTETMDLGWVATHVAVPVTYLPVAPVRPIYSPFLHAQASPPAQAADESQSTAEAQSTAGVPAAIPEDVRALPYGGVLEKLRGWERSHNAAR